MAYFRRDVQDHVTKMTKELYDNLQDGIDESKGDIKTLQEEVVLLKEESTNTGGVISDSEEDVFSEDKEYKAGDLVIYNNVLYKFIEDKSPGEWIEESVQITTITNEVSLLGGVRLGFTEDGQPGYIVTDEDGADSVIPFSSISLLTSRNQWRNIYEAAYHGTTRNFTKPKGITNVIVLFMSVSDSTASTYRITGSCIKSNRRVAYADGGQSARYTAYATIDILTCSSEEGTISVISSKQVGSSDSSISISVVY